MFSALVAALALVSPVLGVHYSLTDSFVGSGFLEGFVNDAIPDPTSGRVYVPVIVFQTRTSHSLFTVIMSIV